MLAQLPSRETWYQLGLGLLAVAVGGGLGFAILYVENPLLSVAAVAGVVLAFFTITNSNFGLLVLVFLVYMRFSDVMVRSHGAPSILQPYILLVLVGIVARWVFRQELSRDWGKVSALVIAYTVVIFSSLFYAADFTVAWETGLDFLKDGIITVILVILINRMEDFRKVIWTLLVVGVLLGTLSVYQGIFGLYDNDFWGFALTGGVQNIIGDTEGNRVAGPIGDPNYYAQILLVIVPLSINRFANEKHWLLKMLAGWALIVCSLAIVYTYSRGAVVAAVFMVIYTVIFRKPRITDMVLGVLLVVIILSFMPANYMSRVATISDAFGDQNIIREEVSFRGRASETIVAWLMFMDRPVFGVGANNYPVYYQFYSRSLGLDPRAEERQAHNLYLQIAAETGLAGIFVFGGILWSLFKGMQNSWRRLKQVALDDYTNMFFSFEVGMVGYLVAAFFIHAAYPRYFWMLAGIAFAIPQIADKLLTSKAEEMNE